MSAPPVTKSPPAPTRASSRGDNIILKTVPTVLVAAAVVVVLVFQDEAAAVINRLRTMVTSGWTWYFVVYSLIALGVCAWVVISKKGSIRLGGPGARPEHSKFAWYSMLFGAGQGIGLIFWSAAEPILMREEAPVVSNAAGTAEGGLVWTYFHWGVTAWAMYCVVAVCLAYSHHNLGKNMTFRDATVDILPERVRRPAGLVIEVLAIIATVLGLATSFGFAALQLTSGLSSFTSVTPGLMIWVIVILGLAGVTALSAFLGVNKGMKRVSELNSGLSLLLIAGVLVFGPTIFILSNVSQTFGSFITHFVPMSFFTEASAATGPLDSWQDSWNGAWTVFIWCWVIAFSPFVSGFIARISRGRTLREFVLGVTVVPSLIVMVWVGIIGSAALRYDDETGSAISEDVAAEVSSGLFSTLTQVPVIGGLLLVVATLLVATYYITSLDAGTYALAVFASASKESGPWFRVILVAIIGAVAFTLLVLGGSAVVDTVQTGTILGAFPFSFAILLMIVNFIRRLRLRDDEPGTADDESVVEPSLTGGSTVTAGPPAPEAGGR